MKPTISWTNLRLPKRARRLSGAILAITVPLLTAFPKDVPLRISFEMPQQGMPVAQPFPIRLKILNHTVQASGCTVRLTSQAYTNVLRTSSAVDFRIVPAELVVDPLPPGETVRELQLSFARDGEYRVFGEARCGPIGAAEGFCFIVRNGLVYGAPFFDQCEFMLLLQNVLRAKGDTNDVQELRRQFDERRREREQLKRGLVRAVGVGSGINIGDTVTILANWTGPKEVGGATSTVLPVLNCMIEIWKVGAPTPIRNGYVRNGRFTFVSQENNLDFEIRFILDFDGFGGQSRFQVRDFLSPFTYPIYTNRFQWSELQRVGNQFTYTAPFHSYTSPMAAADLPASAWGVFHGIQEILRLAQSELGVNRANDTVIFFPRDAGSEAQPWNNSIWFHSGDRYDFDAIAHELGHVINEDHNVIIPEGGKHNSRINQYDYSSNLQTFHNKTKSLRLAFGEAFATAWGVGLLKTSVYRGQLANVGDEVYSDTENTEANGSPPIEYSLEAQPFLDCFGEDAERALMRLLWDLLDNNDEAYTPATPALADRTHEGLAGLWNRLRHPNDPAPYENISDFWLRNWLPGGTVNNLDTLKALTPESLAVAETFVAMGLAPHLIWPTNRTEVDFTAPGLQLDFRWQDLIRTSHPALELNWYALVLYKPDMSIVIAIELGNCIPTTYTLTPADIADINANIPNYKGLLIAVIFGENRPTEGDGKIATGPYASNGVKLFTARDEEPPVLSCPGWGPPDCPIAWWTNCVLYVPDVLRDCSPNPPITATDNFQWVTLEQFPSPGAWTNWRCDSVGGYPVTRVSIVATDAGGNRSYCEFPIWVGSDCMSRPCLTWVPTNETLPVEADCKASLPNFLYHVIEGVASM